MSAPGIVLVSGGMDSCVTAAQARADGCELAFLHVNYG
ncbi:MAG: 7-cyano-7-deazaguanine synthase, partial [Armatimonadetes bacterium CG06_land_8_20_14_3_00_66_21]